MSQKRYGWARLTEEQNDEIGRAKADFAAKVKSTSPVKQMWVAAEWLVSHLAKWLGNFRAE